MIWSLVFISTILIVGIFIAVYKVSNKKVNYLDSIDWTENRFLIKTEPIFFKNLEKESKNFLYDICYSAVIEKKNELTIQVIELKSRFENKELIPENPDQYACFIYWITRTFSELPNFIEWLQGFPVNYVCTRIRELNNKEYHDFKNEFHKIQDSKKEKDVNSIIITASRLLKTSKIISEKEENNDKFQTSINFFKL